MTQAVEEAVGAEVGDADIGEEVVGVTTRIGDGLVEDKAGQSTPPSDDSTLLADRTYALPTL